MTLKQKYFNAFLFTGEDAKKKWRSLRDTYMREIKKVNKPRSGSSADDPLFYTGKWQYFEAMSFLRDSLMPNMTESNVEEVEAEFIASQSPTAPVFWQQQSPTASCSSQQEEPPRKKKKWSRMWKNY